MPSWGLGCTGGPQLTQTIQAQALVRAPSGASGARVKGGQPRRGRHPRGDLKVPTEELSQSRHGASLESSQSRELTVTRTACISSEEQYITLRRLIDSGCHNDNRGKGIIPSETISRPCHLLKSPPSKRRLRLLILDTI